MDDWAPPEAEPRAARFYIFSTKNFGFFEAQWHDFNKIFKNSSKYEEVLLFDKRFLCCLWASLKAARLNDEKAQSATIYLNNEANSRRNRAAHVKQIAQFASRQSSNSRRTKQLLIERRAKERAEKLWGSSRKPFILCENLAPNQTIQKELTDHAKPHHLRPTKQSKRNKRLTKS